MRKSDLQIYQNLSIMIILFVASVGTLAIAEYLRIKTNTNMYNFLIWDIFLAWVPLVLSTLIGYMRNRKRTALLMTMCVLLSLSWLFFLPNAAYLFTEFIHSFRYFDPQGEVKFWENLLFWYSLTIGFATAIIGLLLSVYSIRQMQVLLSRHLSHYTSYLFVGFVMLLSSVGVYIGRFNRCNSWDVLNQPKIIFFEIFNDWHQEGSIVVKFVALLFVIQLFSYLLFCAMTNSKITKDL